MNLQVGVKVIIKNAKGQLLLLKRTTQYLIPAETKDAWDIPGGRIYPDEHLRDALAREVREELGIELIGTPKLLTAQDIFVTQKGLHVVRLTYLHEMEVNGIVLSDEHTGYEWVAVEDAKKLNTEPYLNEVLQSLVG